MMSAQAVASIAPARLIGAVVVLLSLRSLLQTRAAKTRATAGDTIAARWVGAVTWRMARGCARHRLLIRTAEDMALPTRLAVAPTAWTSRLVALAARAAMRSRHAGGTALCLGLPPPAADLMPGIRACAGATAAAATVPLALWIGPGAEILVAALAATAGAWLPDLALRRAARRGMRRGRDAALSVELLAALSGAGTPLAVALDRAAAHAPPGAAASFRSAAVRTSAGEEPGAVLATEGARFGVPLLRDVAGAVGRGRLLGVPLETELRRIASAARAEERARVAERAARRGPLATLVVALVIAPLCVASLAACLIGGLLQNGGTLFR